MAERRMTLGEKVRALRLQLGMTQAELAGEEFTKSFISQIEKNQARPSLKSLRIFAQRLNRPISYFLDDEYDTSPTPSEAQRHLSTADVLERQSKYDEALQLYEQALNECAPTDYALRGQIYRRRARALLALDQRKAAVQALELAAEEFRLARDTAARAEVDQLLGDVYRQMNQKEAAITHYERALLLYEEGLAPQSDTEPSFAMLRLLTELGLTLAAVGRYEAAQKYLKRAESLAAQVKTMYRWGDLCRTMSKVEKELGNRRGAVQYAERAVAYCDAMLDHVTLVRALVDLGELRAEEGGRKAAEPIFERALDVAEAMGDADGKSLVRAALAKLAEKDGDIKRAVELYEAAVNTSEDAWRTSAIRRSLADLFKAQQNWEAAAKQLESNVAFFQKNRATPALIETYTALAEVYEAAGLKEDAERCLKLSLELYRKQSEEAKSESGVSR